MANYECTIRSNYFRVNDETGYQDFIQSVNAEDMHFFERTEGESIFHAFGCEGSLYGIEDGLGGYSYDLFIEGLQKYLVDNDAVIILESGHEKLRYVSGSADIITKKEIFSLDISSLAIQKAREMLCNPDYMTDCDY